MLLHDRRRLEHLHRREQAAITIDGIRVAEGGQVVLTPCPRLGGGEVEIECPVLLAHQGLDVGAFGLLIVQS